jgi:hypothetical protein
VWNKSTTLLNDLLESLETVREALLEIVKDREVLLEP